MIDIDRNATLCIHPHYRHRPDPAHFDDRSMRDEWQNAVYSYARDFTRDRDIRRVVDFGCGSGYKLMKYFAGFETVGYELEPSLSHLLETYPGRTWQKASLDGRFTGDLLICADVIEHLADPTVLMEKIKRGPLQTVILSTPALEILAERGESPRLGPPDNESHVNEWTTREFRDFCAIHLNVIEHLVIDARQGTQLVLADMKR